MKLMSMTIMNNNTIKIIQKIFIRLIHRIKHLVMAKKKSKLMFKINKFHKKVLKFYLDLN